MIPQCEGVIPDRVIRECLSDVLIMAYEHMCISSIYQNVVKCLTKNCPFSILVEDNSVVSECSHCEAPHCNKCNKSHYTNDCSRNDADEDKIEINALRIMDEKRLKAIEEQKRKFTLIPNPESFECLFCWDFILPRKGVILRNCLHCICRNCSNRLGSFTNHVGEILCPYRCRKQLDECEKKQVKLNHRTSLAATKSLSSICSNINSMECEDTHDVISAEQFKRTKGDINTEDRDKICSLQSQVSELLMIVKDDRTLINQLSEEVRNVYNEVYVEKCKVIDLEKEVKQIKHFQEDSERIWNKEKELELPLEVEAVNLEVSSVTPEALRISILGYRSSIHEDTELLHQLRTVDVKQYTISQKRSIPPLLEDIVDKFTNKYREEVLGKIKTRVSLSTWETTKVNCLTLSVALLCQLNINCNQTLLANNLMIYLNDLIEASLPNKVAARTSQIFLLHLCNISDSCTILFNEKERLTLLRYYRAYSASDLIKIPSAYLLVVIFNRMDPVIEDNSIHEVVNYLKIIVEKTVSQSINGFFMGPSQKNEIRMASLKSAIERRAHQTLKEKRRLDLEEMKIKFPLIPNTSSFRCTICDDFILPRKEILLRNCLHSFCKDCLKGVILSKDFISQRRCPYEGCNRELDDGELYALNPEGHTDMVEREASCRFFQCKNEDCTAMSDVTELKSTYKCPKCSKMNCLECEDIHEGMSCEEFRKTKRYLQGIKNRDKIMSHQKHIKCYVCTRQLIQKGGWGATYCDGCGGQTCIFTGKIAGTHDPKKCYCKGEPNCTKQGQYCGCLSSAPCDKECLYGCLPEYPK